MPRGRDILRTTLSIFIRLDDSAYIELHSKRGPKITMKNREFIFLFMSFMKYTFLRKDIHQKLDAAIFSGNVSVQLLDQFDSKIFKNQYTWVTFHKRTAVSR